MEYFKLTKFFYWLNTPPRTYFYQ